MIYKLKIFFMTALFVFSAIIIVSCSKDEIQTPAAVIDETNNGFETYEVAKIFAEKCAVPECHASENPQNGLSLASYSDMLKGSINRDEDTTGHNHTGGGYKIISGKSGVYGGECVIPYNSEYSLLYNIIAGKVGGQSVHSGSLRNILNETEIATLKNWIDSGAKDFKENIAYSNSLNNVYVCSQRSDQIFEINTENNLCSRIINVDFDLFNLDQPHNIQRRGNYLYVTLAATGKLLKIDVNSNAVVARVDTLFAPGMIAISPDGKTAYVSKVSIALDLHKIIYRINLETMERLEDIILPDLGLPYGITISHDGKFVYVADIPNDKIAIIDAVTNQFVDYIPLSPDQSLVNEPLNVYVSPDDKYLYVCCRKSSKFLVIDVQSRQIISELEIKTHPWQAAVSSDGSKIYIVSHHEPVITTVTKVGDSWSVTDEFIYNGFSNLLGADLSPDGKYLYVTCSNVERGFTPFYSIPGRDMPSMVGVFDTQTKDLIKIFDVGNEVTGIVAREN